MIEAKKSLWFEKIFAVYNHNLLKRRFSKFSVSNLESLKENDQPKIIFVNHSSWWDGLVAFEISRSANLDSFVMMEEKNLRKYFLFRRIGAFSVNKNNSRDVLETIRYASEMLRSGSRKAVWIFPQGEIKPSGARPLKFNSGIVKILESVENCLLIPVTISYEFTGDYKPEIFVKIGESINAENLKSKKRKEAANDLSEILTALLDHLNDEVAAADLKSYENILT